MPALLSLFPACGQTSSACHVSRAGFRPKGTFFKRAIMGATFLADKSNLMKSNNIYSTASTASFSAGLCVGHALFIPTAIL
jgi:hypothetical protein